MDIVKGVIHDWSDRAGLGGMQTLFLHFGMPGRFVGMLESSVF